MGVIKLTQTGDLDWAVEVGAPEKDEEPGRILPTEDGGVIVVGFTKGAGLNDVLLFKLNAQGEKEWV